MARVDDGAGAPAAGDIEAAVAAGDYIRAARLAEAAGDLRRAIVLYERIWRFAEARALAERLDDVALALRLALDDRDEGRARHLAAGIPDHATADLTAAGDVLAARGRWAEAAAMAERAGAPVKAAALYRRGGALLLAARAHERAGQWQEAGRLYEEIATAARTDGDARAAAEAALGAGLLLGRLGRPRDAARALQAAASHPDFAVAARRRLCVELVALGLGHAADEVARTLHATDPALPDSAAALIERELGGAHGRPLADEPLRRFGQLRLIGSGTLGRVYAAEDRLLGQPVVLKIMSVGAGAEGPERQSFLRFLREAEASSRLRHAHIVRLRDVDERAGILVLEYLSGGTLAELLTRQPRLSPPAARRLALELLSALSAAHAAGIVHRDVKPANIFFDAAANAKLADFGAAHLTDFGGTQTAGFIGTLAYLSPEQITGAPVGPAADLYGLGVTLFQALTGRLPFPGPDVVSQHLGEPPPRASAFVPTLIAAHDEVLFRALAKPPADRYPSAEAMAEAVRLWPATLEGRAARTPTPVLRPAAPEDAAPSETSAQPRRLVGRTARGTLVATVDPRVQRPVLLEELERPLDLLARQALGRLAQAGGPFVQRVLAVEDEGRRVVYEAPGGETVPASALPPGEAAKLREAWPIVQAAGLVLRGDHPVARTPGGPVILVVAPETPAYAAEP